MPPPQNHSSSDPPHAPASANPVPVVPVVHETQLGLLHSNNSLNGSRLGRGRTALGAPLRARRGGQRRIAGKIRTLAPEKAAKAPAVRRRGIPAEAQQHRLESSPVQALDYEPRRSKRP